ncbi:MAG: WD40 repeat domain-containing protein [Pseudomonadota bacterium]
MRARVAESQALGVFPSQERASALMVAHQRYAWFLWVAVMSLGLLLAAPARPETAGTETAFCADPAGTCAALIPPACLNRLGAGSIAADDLSASTDACPAAMSAYSQCLARAARECSAAPDAGAQPASTASGACSPERVDRLWTRVEERADCGSYAAFLRACPDAIWAPLAESERQRLGCDRAAEPRASSASATTERPLRILRGHERGVYAIALSADGETVVSGGHAGEFMVRSLHSGSIVRNLQIGEQTMTDVVLWGGELRVAFAAARSGDLLVVPLAEQRPAQALPRHKQWIWDLALSPDQRRLATASADGDVALWELPPPNSAQALRPTVKSIYSVADDGAYSVAFTPDGTQVITGSRKGGVSVWSALDGLLLADHFPHRETLWALAPHPDNRTVLTASGDSTALLVDLATGDVIHRFTGHRDAVYAAAITRDGRYGITGSKDQTIKLWELQSGRLLATYTAHEGAVTVLATHPDGRRFVSGSLDGAVMVWALPER